MRKKFIRFFTIADYEDEELWLREMNIEGWKLVDMTVPCFYHFESCEPEDVIYRLDFKNNMQDPEYMQMTSDFGWEYVTKCNGWLYFRKHAKEIEVAEEGELFSDNYSRVELVRNIVKTRLWPLVIVFFGIIIPNVFNTPGYDESARTFFTVFFGIMFVLYVYLIIYCGIKLKKIRSKYEK